MPKQKALDADVTELKQQLAVLRGETEDVVESLADRVNGYVERAAAKDGEAGTAQARDAVDQGRAAVVSMAEETAVRALEAEKSVLDAIRDRPLMSVGLAFAVGLILGKATSVAGRRS